MPVLWPDAQHIYLGAHLDDIILSCGGTIAQQAAAGESIAAVTIFAASPPTGMQFSPFAETVHARWSKAFSRNGRQFDLNAIRRGEDILAFAELGPNIEVFHYSQPDCIYRVDPTTGIPLYDTEEKIFGNIHPADPAPQDLSTTLPAPDGAIVYAPLAIGNHVDHQILRTAVERWEIRGELYFYEDFPYVSNEDPLESAIVDAARWSTHVASLSTQDIHRKKRAVTQYVSQLSTFWQSEDELAEHLYDHAEATGGERFWVRMVAETASV